MAEELKVIENIDDITVETLDDIDAMGAGDEEKEEAK